MEQQRSLNHSHTNQQHQDDWDDVHNQLLAIQKKSLAVSNPADADEKEADEVSRKVMSGESAGIHGTGGTINRKGEGTAETTPEFQLQLESSKGGGQSLPGNVQQEMGSKMNADFSGVKVHTDSKASSMNESVNAKAFVNQQDIYFGNGNYNPDSSEGKELLAHELVHTRQQGDGKVQPKIQRTAKASWEDATESDKLSLLSEKDQKKYKSQNEPGADKPKKPIELSKIEKMLRIAASYHYYEKYPSRVAGKNLLVDQMVITEVNKQFKVGQTPDFWDDIIWFDKNGIQHKIGVRFDITFQSHTPPANASPSDISSGKSISDTLTKPSENVLVAQEIDELSQLVFQKRWNLIKDALSKNAITEITFNQDNSEATYNNVIYSTATQPFEIQQIIQQLMVTHKKPDVFKTTAIEEVTEGKAIGEATGTNKVAFDAEKTAPSKYPIYSPNDQIIYKDYEKDRWFTKEYKDYSKDKGRNAKVASVIAHEIGHNIGMGHTDSGLMAPIAEQTSETQTPTSMTREENGDKSPMIGSGDLYKNELDFGVDYLNHTNVQLLVNRIRAMTIAPIPNGEKDKTGFWKTNETEFFKKLNAKDFAGIFSNEMYASSMYIPYGKENLKDLVNRELFTKDDRIIVEGVQVNGMRMTLDEWNKLSKSAHDYIIKETNKNTRWSGGLTYFEDEDSMNKPF